MVLALVGTLGGLEGRARADTPPSGSVPAEARQLYERAAQAYAEKRNFVAIDLFLKASRLTPSASFSYNIGLAYEDAGDVRNALRYFRDYLYSSPEAPDRLQVLGRIAQLEKKLQAFGVQQVTVRSEPSGATLFVDSAALAITPATFELAPGRHEFHLQHRGYADTTGVAEVPPDRSIDLLYTMQDSVNPLPAAGAQGTSPMTQPFTSDSAQGLARIQPLSWALLGVGTGSLIGSLLFGMSSASAADEARTAPNADRANTLDRRATARQSASLTLLGVGSVTLITGGVLAFLDWRSPSRQTTARARQLAVGCDDHGFVAAYSGSF